MSGNVWEWHNNGCVVMVEFGSEVEGHHYYIEQNDGGHIAQENP